MKKTCGKARPKSADLYYDYQVSLNPSLLKTFTSTALFDEEVAEEIYASFEDQSIESLPIKFAAIATDLLSGKEIVIKSGSLKQALMASSAIPGFYPPVKKDGQLLIDGSASDSVPVHVLKNREPTVQSP